MPSLSIAPAVVAVAATLGYGHWRMSVDSSRPGPKVALIQGSIDTEMKSDPTQGQKIFNELKGSISARLDVQIADDDDRRPTYDDFVAAGAAGKVIPATSILAQQAYVDAISAALANYADKYPNGVASDVLHTLDNYADLLLSSCWPACQK